MSYEPCQAWGIERHVVRNPLSEKFFMTSSVLQTQFCCVTSVSFNTLLNSLVPPDSPARNHQFRQGWTRVQPDFSHQGDLRTRFDSFDDAGIPRRAYVKYSFGRHRQMDELCDSNPFLSTVADGLDLFRRYADPRERTLWDYHTELSCVELSEVRLACYFASATGWPPGIIELVRLHCLRGCLCKSRGDRTLVMSPLRESCSGLTAAFSLIPKALPSNTTANIQGKLAKFPLGLTEQGGIRVELNMSGKWLLSHGIRHPADWDGIDLQAFCVNEIRRYVSLDVDSYWRQSSDSQYANRALYLRLRQFGGILKLPPNSTLEERKKANRETSKQFAANVEEFESSVAQGRIASSQMVGYFSQGNMVPHESICEAKSVFF